MASKRINFMPLKPIHPKKKGFQGHLDAGKIFINTGIFAQNTGKYIECAGNFCCLLNCLNLFFFFNFFNNY